MLLGQLVAQYEEALIAVGEEAESLSFAYRALKKSGPLRTLSLLCKNEVEAEDQALLDSIFEQLKDHVPAQYIIGSAELKKSSLEQNSIGSFFVFGIYSCFFL